MDKITEEIDRMITAQQEKYIELTYYIEHQSAERADVPAAIGVAGQEGNTEKITNLMELYRNATLSELMFMACQAQVCLSILKLLTVRGDVIEESAWQDQGRIVATLQSTYDSMVHTLFARENAARTLLAAAHSALEEAHSALTAHAAEPGEKCIEVLDSAITAIGGK